MSLVNNLQILFKLNGQCDLIKDGRYVCPSLES